MFPGSEVTSILAKGLTFFAVLAVKLSVLLIVALVRVLFRLLPWLVPAAGRLLLHQPGLVLTGLIAAVMQARANGWEWPDNPIVPFVGAALVGLTAASVLDQRERARPPKQWHPGKIRQDGWVYEKRADQFTSWEKRRWERMLARQAKPPSKTSTAARRVAARAKAAQARVDQLVAVPQRPPDPQLPFPEVADYDREATARGRWFQTWRPPPPSGKDNN
jgi:hypothetical protein